jgi:hypothetical protein
MFATTQLSAGAYAALVAYALLVVKYVVEWGFAEFVKANKKQEIWDGNYWGVRFAQMNIWQIVKYTNRNSGISSKTMIRWMALMIILTQIGNTKDIFTAGIRNRQVFVPNGKITAWGVSSGHRDMIRKSAEKAAADNSTIAGLVVQRNTETIREMLNPLNIDIGLSLSVQTGPSQQLLNFTRVDRRLRQPQFKGKFNARAKVCQESGVADKELNCLGRIESPVTHQFEVEIVVPTASTLARVSSIARSINGSIKSVGREINGFIDIGIKWAQMEAQIGIPELTSEIDRLREVPGITGKAMICVPKIWSSQAYICAGIDEEGTRVLVINDVNEGGNAVRTNMEAMVIEVQDRLEYDDLLDVLQIINHSPNLAQTAALANPIGSITLLKALTRVVAVRAGVEEVTIGSFKEELSYDARYFLAGCVVVIIAIGVGLGSKVYARLFEFEIPESKDDIINLAGRELDHQRNCLDGNADCKKIPKTGNYVYAIVNTMSGEQHMTLTKNPVNRDVRYRLGSFVVGVKKWLEAGCKEPCRLEGDNGMGNMLRGIDGDIVEDWLSNNKRNMMKKINNDSYLGAKIGEHTYLSEDIGALPIESGCNVPIIREPIYSHAIQDVQVNLRDAVCSARPNTDSADVKIIVERLIMQYLTVRRPLYDRKGEQATTGTAQNPGLDSDTRRRNAVSCLSIVYGAVSSILQCDEPRTKPLVIHSTLYEQALLTTYLIERSTDEWMAQHGEIDDNAKAQISELISSTPIVEMNPRLLKSGVILDRTKGSVSATRMGIKDRALKEIKQKFRTYYEDSWDDVAAIRDARSFYMEAIDKFSKEKNDGVLVNMKITQDTMKAYDPKCPKDVGNEQLQLTGLMVMSSVMASMLRKGLEHCNLKGMLGTFALNVFVSLHSNANEVRIYTIRKRGGSILLEYQTYMHGKINCTREDAGKTEPQHTIPSIIAQRYTNVIFTIE